MAKKIKLFLGAFLLFCGWNAFAVHAQDSAPVQWTIVDGAGQPAVSTSQDSYSSSPAVDASTLIPENQKNDRQKEMEKAMQGAAEKDPFKSPEISQESIELMFAPYREQNKQEFLSIQGQSLQDVIERAKAIHTQAKAAQEGISLAQRRLILAVRQMFPEMTFEYGHRDGSLSAAEYLSRSQRVSFRQPLFRGGILWNTFLQERKMLEAARSNYQKVMDELVFEISKVYFEYQRARAVSDDQKKVLETVKPQVEISDKKFAQNLTSEIEHLNAQSLAGQIEFDYETAKQELEIAMLDLQHYLGLGIQDSINLKPEYDVDQLLAGMSESDDVTVSQIEAKLGAFNQGKPIPGLEKLVEMSYGHRSELSVQVSQLQAARYGERVRWGGLVPKADLVLEYGVLAEAFKQFTNNPNHKGEFRMMLEVDWNAAGNKINYTFENDQRAPSVTQFQSGAGTLNKRNSFSVGLLNGLDVFVDVKQAEVEKLNKVVELEQAEKKVLEEVKRAYYDYQKALIQMKSSMKRVEWRKRLKDLAEHRLGQTEVEVSEYLQAEIDLLRERGDFHAALRDYYGAKASLNYAVGVREFFETEKNGKT